MDQGFTERFSGNVGDHADPDLIDADLQALCDEAAAISAYVDRHLAHTDEDPLGALPTYVVLNAAIDQIGSVFRKYSLLLTASSWWTLVPAIQYDWLAAFREPWLLAQHEDAVRGVESDATEQQ